MFKVNKKKFLQSYLYLRKIDHSKILNLDLSELFEGDLEEAKKEFVLTGLDATYFITSDWYKNYPNIKPKFEITRLGKG